MPTITHVERHVTATDTVRDIVIGMSDGLTVPFALAAGLSGAVQATNVVKARFTGVNPLCGGLQTRVNWRLSSSNLYNCATYWVGASAPRVGSGVVS